MALEEDDLEEILNQDSAIDILSKAPNQEGERTDVRTLLVNDIEFQLINTDPFNEEVEVVTSYTCDTHAVEFEQGMYAKRLVNDKEIVNNYKAWINHVTDIQTGHCIVTNIGQSIDNDYCRFIFHSIAPIYMEITQESCVQLLQQCVVNCLQTAKTLGLSSIAMPLISKDDDFKFPAREASQAILTAVKVWMDQQDPEELGSLKDIRLCVPDKILFGTVSQRFTSIFEQLPLNQ